MVKLENLLAQNEICGNQTYPAVNHQLLVPVREGFGPENQDVSANEQRINYLPRHMINIFSTFLGTKTSLFETVKKQVPDERERSKKMHENVSIISAVIKDMLPQDPTGPFIRAGYVMSSPVAYKTSNGIIGLIPKGKNGNMTQFLQAAFKSDDNYPFHYNLENNESLGILANIIATGIVTSAWIDDPRFIDPKEKKEHFMNRIYEGGKRAISVHAPVKINEPFFGFEVESVHSFTHRYLPGMRYVFTNCHETQMKKTLPIQESSPMSVRLHTVYGQRRETENAPSLDGVVYAKIEVSDENRYLFRTILTLERDIARPNNISCNLTFTSRGKIIGECRTQYVNGEKKITNTNAELTAAIPALMGLVSQETPLSQNQLNALRYGTFTLPPEEEKVAIYIGPN